MSNNKITGAGGGKGGKQPIEAPNTLQSRSTIKVVEVLSEGPVVGVLNGLKGVYFDDTPVQNTDDSYNFPAVKFAERYGLPSQDYIPGFSDGTESPVSVGVDLDSTGIVRDVDGISDAVRVVVRLPQGLYTADNDNGDLLGYRVGIAIDTRLTSGTWSTVKTKTISGKTLNAYEEAYRIERPDEGGSTAWQVRVRRTTTPSASVKTVDDIEFWSYTQIKDIKLTYDDASIVGVALDSESTGGQVPKRSYLVEGRTIQIPHNYTPRVYNALGEITTNASYTGGFSGALVTPTVACDNPAWVLYDILVNERYGTGEYIDSSSIDIYSFYDAAVYCDELVDNGSGGTEPRYRFNAVIQTREDAFKTIQAVAASMRAFVFSGSGLIKIIQDRPSAVAANITNANVIDGRFTYSGTDNSNRITACTVTYSDASNKYYPKTVIEEADTAQITRYGYNKEEIAAIGTTSEAQARRFAKWVVDTSINEADIISFTVSWQNAFIQIGDIISVADNFIANYQLGGLIVGGSTNTIILDRNVTVTSGATIRYIRWDGSESSRTILNSPGVYSTLTLSGSEDVTPYIGSAWGLYGDIQPRLYKIVQINESEIGKYEVAAHYHDPSKYDRIESGIIVDPPLFGNPTNGNSTVSQPLNLTVEPETVIDANGAVRYKIRLNWNDTYKIGPTGVEFTDTLNPDYNPTDPSCGINPDQFQCYEYLPIRDVNFRNYKVRYRKDNGQFIWSDDLLQSEFLIDNVINGVYEFFVYAYSTSGAQSPASTIYYSLNTNSATSGLNAPSNLLLEGGGTNFTGLAFAVVWDAPAESTSTSYILLDYEVKIYDGATLIKTFDTVNRRMDITREEVIAWAGSAIRSLSFEVRSRDTLRNLSLPVTAVITNNAPSVPSGITLTQNANYYEISHNASPDSDAIGVLVYHSTVNGFTPSASNLVKRDAGVKHLIEATASTTYYVRIGFYDTWSESNLNLSSQQTITTGSSAVGITPTAPTGLTVTSSSALIGGYYNSEYILNIQWNKGADASQYDIEIIEGTNNAFYPTVAQPDSGTIVNYQMVALPNTLYKVRVRSRTATSVSVYTSQVNHTTTGDTTIPATPTSFTLTAGYQAAVVKWVIPTDLDLFGTQIWRRPSGDSSSGTLITTVAAPLTAYFDTGLTIGSTYEYRIRSIDTSSNTSTYSSWLSVTAANVPDESIAASQILSHSITANQIQSNSITSNEIAVGSLTGDRIQANSITSNEIAVGAIIAGIKRNGVATFTNTGTLDTSPAPYDIDGDVYSVTKDTSGRIIIAGSFTRVNGIARTNICRFNTLGDVDTTFAPSSTVNGVIYSVASDASNNILIAGIFTQVGASTRIGFASYNSTGGLNAVTCNLAHSGSFAAGTVVKVLSDGTYLIGGSFTTAGGSSRHNVVRINSSGTVQSVPITGFTVGATSTIDNSSLVYDLDRDSSSNYYFAGQFTGFRTSATTGTGSARSRIAKVNSSNTLQTFNNTSINDVVYTIKPLSTGECYIGGNFTAPSNKMFKSSSTGSTLVTNYDIDNGTVRKIETNASGDVYVVGEFSSVNTDTTFGSIAKYNSSGLLYTDFANNIGLPAYGVYVDQTTGYVYVVGSFKSVGGSIKARSISGDHIEARSIDADRLVSRSILAENIAANSITVNEIASSIQSDNYAAGSAGWKINKAGDVEFNEVTARGGLTTDIQPNYRVEVRPPSQDATYAIWAGSGATKSDSNAKFFIKHDGSAYFDGALVRGQINTSNQVNGTDSSIVNILGPYTASVATANVIMTAQYGATLTTSGTCGTAPSTPTCTVVVERSTNGTSWTTIGTIPITGQSSQEYDLETNTCFKAANWYNSTQINDTFGTAGNRYYRARFTSFSIPLSPSVLYIDLHVIQGSSGGTEALSDTVWTDTNTAITANRSHRTLYRLTSTSAVTITLPSSANIGTAYNFVKVATGSLTFAVDSGTLLNGTGLTLPTSSSQYKLFTAIKTTATEWLLTVSN